LKATIPFFVEAVQELFDPTVAEERVTVHDALGVPIDGARDTRMVKKGD
jgi:hypothetical protein